MTRIGISVQLARLPTTSLLDLYNHWRGLYKLCLFIITKSFTVSSPGVRILNPNALIGVTGPGLRRTLGPRENSNNRYEIKKFSRET